MSKELFAARLKAAMEKQQLKRSILSAPPPERGSSLEKAMSVSMSAEKHYRVQIS